MLKAFFICLAGPWQPPPRYAPFLTHEKLRVAPDSFYMLYEPDSFYALYEAGLRQCGVQSCNCNQRGYRTDQELMGQKDEKQPISDKSKQKINRGGMFSRADVRGYARMRRAMLERQKREKEESN